MWVYTTGACATWVDLPVEMRANPTVANVGDPVNTAGGQVATDKWAIYQTAWLGCASFTIQTENPKGFRFDCAVNTAFSTNGGACGIYGGGDCYFTADAEL